ncbi:MAG: DUF4876 domain-containing protein [Candidatus Cryptobacteroides sp.]
MMKKFTYIALTLIVTSSCLNLDKFNPYSGDTHNMKVCLSLADGTVADGASVTVEDIMNGNRFASTSGADGSASFQLTNGLYRISANFTFRERLYNGTLDRVLLSGEDDTRNLTLEKVMLNDLVIKEIYCGGCKKLPQEGDYQYDKYIILHNNSTKDLYLDGVCLGMYSPYNSNANNPWISRDSLGNTVYRDFVPAADAIWQFPGDGKTFPLAPGKDAVIAINGAIDHSAQYPLSVNLNNEDYFVCYNATYFPNTSYHPAPGDRIRQDHILNVVVKTGISNAYPLSINSPAVVIFKTEGMTAQEFTQLPGSIQNIPGSTTLKVTCVPLEWVLDAVEVFNGTTSNNTKRVAPMLDAGYVSLEGSYMGHSLVRKTDAEKTEEYGFEVLKDTNNSSEDFYESATALLHDAGEGATNE